MKLIRHIDRMAQQFRGSAVSIGNFDGVHRGHARIMERLSAMARQRGTTAVVFTFDPHPSRILRPQSVPTPLCWPERKAELLGELGVEAVVAYPTDQAFLQLDARQFFDQIICQQLQARAIVEGANFFFGHDRTGNIEVLKRFCAETGIAIEVVEPVTIDGQVVSSSRLRQLVAAGQIDQACALLTRPYRIRGTVVR
jgi:riboflavin kinase/FMN adenylyltransferase